MRSNSNRLVREETRNYFLSALYVPQEKKSSVRTLVFYLRFRGSEREKVFGAVCLRLSAIPDNAIRTTADWTCKFYTSNNKCLHKEALMDNLECSQLISSILSVPANKRPNSTEFSAVPIKIFSNIKVWQSSTSKVPFEGLPSALLVIERDKKLNNYTSTLRCCESRRDCEKRGCSIHEKF